MTGWKRQPTFYGENMKERKKPNFIYDDDCADLESEEYVVVRSPHGLKRIYKNKKTREFITVVENENS
jgi:hypothetical protein